MAVVVFLLYFFAWIEEETDSGEKRFVGGIAITTQNVEPTRNFPTPLLFVIPYVTGSIIYQYGIRLRQSVRPRRRLESAMMVSTALIILSFWLRLYVVNAAERGQDQDPFTPTPLVTYTREEILQDVITPYFWVMVVGLVLLILVPFLDRRPVAPPPDYLKTAPPLN